MSCSIQPFKIHSCLCLIFHNALWPHYFWGHVGMVTYLATLFLGKPPRDSLPIVIKCIFFRQCLTTSSYWISGSRNLLFPQKKVPEASINCADKQQFERAVDCLVNKIGEIARAVQWVCLKPSWVQEFRARGSCQFFWFDIWAASWENQHFAYAKTKTQISFAVTAKLISAFVFPT